MEGTTESTDNAARQHEHVHSRAVSTYAEGASVTHYP